MKVCGESGDVQSKTIDSWKDRFPEILEGYEKENIDETGIFWQALPDCSFGSKGKQYREERRVNNG